MSFMAVSEVRTPLIYSPLQTDLVTDIGGTLFGSWLRYVILASIVLSQMGFVSAYIIFVAQSLQVRYSTLYMKITNDFATGIRRGC